MSRTKKKNCKLYERARMTRYYVHTLYYGVSWFGRDEKICIYHFRCRFYPVICILMTASTF